MNGYFDYWGKAHGSDQAKPFHLLPFHALDVAAVGAELLARDTKRLEKIAALSGFSATSLRKVLPYLLALHDLGKFSEPFQDQLPELVKNLQGARDARPSRLRHDSIGYLLWRCWSSLKPDPREVELLPKLHGISLSNGPLGARDVGDVMLTWMAAVLGHHGKPPEATGLPFDVFKAHPDKPLARSRQDAAAFALAVNELLEPGALISQANDVDALIAQAQRASWWVAGFAILCDWLGSDTQFFQYEREPRSLESYWSDARSFAADAVDRSGLIGSSPRSFGGIATLFPSITTPSPLQEAASETDLGAGPQLFVLEDLTGSGKTEAALVLAHRLMAAGRADGLFFALPTMATANAMHARVRPLLEKLFEGRPSYLLTHSGPHLSESDWLAIGGGKRDDSYGHGEQPPASRAASAWLSDGRKKALLAELGVGTIDQALLAALQSKHAALRLLGLHRHVLVVDEVHACDAYMLGILCALLKMQAALGGSAILLSATLPKEQRRRLIRAFAQGLGEAGAPVPSSDDYPLLTGFGRCRIIEQRVDPRPDSPRTIAVAWHGSVEAVVARLMEAARAGQCACWVRNSVADAREAYEAVTALLGVEQVTLFHARFALGDRLRIEQDVVKRFGANSKPTERSGQVVIATQVVEQSLDIDFDVMVSDLCPIDLLIQRSGRLQRHPGRKPQRPAPVLEVLAPAWADDPLAGWLGGPLRRTALVYDDPAVLWRTARELNRCGQLALPADARALVEAVYGCDDVPPAFERRNNAAVGKEMSHASVAQNAVLKLDLGYVREGSDWSNEARTPTRLGEPTTTVRLARLTAGTSVAWCTEVEPRLRWPLSQVSVARRLIAKAAPGDEAMRQVLEADQPFLGDDIVTLLLREESPGHWTGEALAERTRGDSISDVLVRVTYSSRHGLDVKER